MIRTIIVEDEVQNRQRITKIIQENFPKIQIVGEAENVESALEVISNKNPDLVFLDIELGDGTAFDLLNKLDSIEFKIIFVTAYEQYALKAIKLSALDYILKPISLEDMNTAVNKAMEQIQKDLKIQLKELSQSVNTDQKKKIVLKTAEKLLLISIEEIIRCEADRNYTYFYIKDGKKEVVSNPLKEYDEVLTEQGFFRIHKSHLVNLLFVDSYMKSEGGHIVLKDGTILPVALRKKNQLIELFENL